MAAQTDDVSVIKSKLTLDFNGPVSFAKKAKFKTCILESPDLKMLKLGSPELERLIMQQTGHGLVTPTPSAALPYLLKQEEVSNRDEREEYAKGFVEALKQLQDCDKGESSAQSKQLVAEPIDMADQEKIKLERKRQRNRIAASKCRQKKLERISVLEDKVSALKGENGELAVVASKLRDQVCSLKQQILDHVNYGCQLSADR